MTCISHSEEETRRIASALGEKAVRGEILALEGDLGAGKTVFAKGFAQGLAYPYPEDVVSPTFTLIKEYRGGRLPLYHFDLYRLEDPAEAEEIGIDEYLFGDGVCLIEWAERAEELLPRGTGRVRIERIPDAAADERRITIMDGTDGS